MQLVVVAPFIDQMHAEMLKGHLAAENIEAFIAETGTHSYRGGAAHKLAVWEKDEKRALEIVAEIYPEQISLLNVHDLEINVVADGAYSSLNSFLQSGKNQVIALILIMILTAIVYFILLRSGNI